MKSFACGLCSLVLAFSGSLLAVDVHFLAWDEAIAAREVAVAEGEKESKIENLHPLQRTGPISTSVPEGIVTVRALDKKGPDGKPLDLPVKVGTAMSKPLILLLPDAKSPTGLRGYAIEDDSASFPWGSFRMLNATGKVLNMGLGSERKQLPANWQHVDLRPSGNKPLPVWFATPEAPKDALYTSVWKPDPEMRRLVILLPGSDPRFGPLALKVIPEDRSSLATAP